MAKGIICPKLAEALRANPNVEKAASRTVVFKPSFIEHVLYQYLRAGKARVEIFGGGGDRRGRSGEGKAEDCLRELADQAQV